MQKAVGAEIGCAILDGAKPIILRPKGMAMVNHNIPGYRTIHPGYYNTISQRLSVTFVSSYLFPDLAFETECHRVAGMRYLYAVGLGAGRVRE